MDRKGRRKPPIRRLRAPRVSKRTKFLFSLSTKEHLLHGDIREETVEERIAFLPPLPSTLAIQSRALDQDILQLIKEEVVRFVGLKNISLEWVRGLLKEVASGTCKHRFHSTTSRPWLAFKECAATMKNPYLVPGTHNEQILQEKDEEKDAAPIESNSPKLLSESSESPPIKKPRSRFMATLFNERSFESSHLSTQLREIVCKGTTTLEKFIYKKPIEKVRYRAKDCGLDVVLPLQVAPKTNARWLFRMDVEDTLGMTAYFWKKWIHAQLSKRVVIAKSITDSEIRFSLPSDLHSLEGLSVVDYLETNCAIAKSRMVIYETLYSRMKQAVINVQALKEAILKLIPTTPAENCLNELIDLLDLPEDYAFKTSTFCKCLGLSERLFAPVDKSNNEDEEISMDEAEQWKFQAGPLERLDFCQVSRRLTPLEVNPRLKRLLEKLERQINWQLKDFQIVPFSRRFTENPIKRLFKRAKSSIQKYEAAKMHPTFRLAHH